jgi:hypothetical protein
MTNQKPIVVRLERLPHRHAVVRVRNAFRQLRQMQMKVNRSTVDINICSQEQIVQETKS